MKETLKSYLLYLDFMVINGLLYSLSLKDNVMGRCYMRTNFDYLKKEPKFSRFADVAISAEKIILMDPEASVLTY